MKTSESVKSIVPAFIKAQALVKRAKKDSINPHFKSHYADFESVVDAIKEALQTNQMWFSQGASEDGLKLITRIWHVSGEWMETYYPITPLADPQKMGSVTSYAKRFCLQGAMGLVTTDDDGVSVSQAQRPATTQPRPAPQQPTHTHTGQPVTNYAPQGRDMRINSTHEPKFDPPGAQSQALQNKIKQGPKL